MLPLPCGITLRWAGRGSLPSDRKQKASPLKTRHARSAARTDGITADVWTNISRSYTSDSGSTWRQRSAEGLCTARNTRRTLIARMTRGEWRNHNTSGRAAYVTLTVDRRLYGWPVVDGAWDVLTNITFS